MGPTAVNLGSPQFPSFMGTKFMHFSHPLAFHQRLFAALVELSFVTVHSALASSMENVCRQGGVCPPDMPSIQNMSRHASLVIHNSVRPLELPARPAVPQELYAGGIQCRPAKPLPEELEAWVQGAGEAGFIFFSLGSIIKGSSMPEKTRVALLEVFAGLEQRVLWKWDQDTMKDLPPNVRLAKWLPQQDILGHPRLRLFITHGGLMSTMEASYHGAPVLGLPVFADQHTNMQLTQVEGWGRYLEPEDITAETMREAVLGVMTDADIQAKAKHRAVLMRDQPMTPAETLVFWVEYVIRHRGAPHLRCPAADMPWYQVYNVDVWGTVAAVVAGVTYLIIRLTVALCSCLCGRRAGKSKKD
ncbi:UDP-glycosyltransferase UGT5-like [Eriocheir sinensis]|uniref:UDP-glycosyltransferase UGT5-like n=1 Tax=Eriocheir sinensis TaxID=95602 RepID=UPI0021C59C94|nr:UDP-glycosyltransferase UGT5-like [Eriocheir sinensis]